MSELENVVITGQNNLIKTMGEKFKNKNLAINAIVEFYPNHKRGFVGNVFAYQIFNQDGLNIGYYIPDTKTLTILECPRVYVFTMEVEINLNDISWVGYHHPIR